MNLDIDQIKKQFFDPYRWNLVTNIYRASASVIVIRGCNGFIATNLGDTAVLINGQTLFPSATPATVLGDSVSVFGNKGEIYGSQQIIVQFVQPLGAAPAVEIVQKFYTVFE